MKPINNIIKTTFIALILTVTSFQVIAQSSIQRSAKNNVQNIKPVNHAESRQSWNFIAYLDDDEIGYHNYEVVNKNGKITVNTEAKFDVSFMFFTVYSYEHINKEIWNKGCLSKLDSSTLDDGQKLFVRLSNANGITRINTPDNYETESTCIRSFAYWDYDLINSRALLNSQTGEMIDVSYTFVGNETINVNNKTQDAKHYKLKGKDSAGKMIDISLWYNSKKQWLALQSKLDNGYSLRYQLKQESVQ